MNTPITPARPVGRIWQIADDVTEAIKWATQYLARGALGVEMRPDGGRVDVLVTLEKTPPDVDNPVLLYAIGADEWLDDSADVINIGTPVYVLPEGEAPMIGTAAGTIQMEGARERRGYLVRLGAVSGWFDESLVTTDFDRAAEHLRQKYNHTLQKPS